MLIWVKNLRLSTVLSDWTQMAIMSLQIAFGLMRFNKRQREPMLDPYPPLER